MKRPVQVHQQFVDVFLGTLHRSQAAGIFTGQGLGARPEQRYVKIFENQCRQRLAPMAGSGITFNPVDLIGISGEFRHVYETSSMGYGFLSGDRGQIPLEKTELLFLSQ